MNSGSVTSDIRRLRKTRTYLITYLTYAQWPVRPWSFVETPVTRTEPDHGKREREREREKTDGWCPLSIIGNINRKCPQCWSQITSPYMRKYNICLNDRYGHARFTAVNVTACGGDPLWVPTVTKSPNNVSTHSAINWKALSLSLSLSLPFSLYVHRTSAVQHDVACTIESCCLNLSVLSYF